MNEVLKPSGNEIHIWRGSRGILRKILGGYLKIDPARVRISFKEKGKPFLNETREGPVLRFNLSHSQDLALYAFADGREIGIDVEAIRPVPHFDRIAQRYFLPAEYEALRAAPPDQKLETFFSYWTRKEALLKAKGGGLSPLRQSPPSEEEGRWSTFVFEPVKGYLAAVVVEGALGVVSLIDFNLKDRHILS